MLEGLEVSEININALEYSGRIDAEYYRKIFLEYENAVMHHDYSQLGKYCKFLIGPFGSAFDTENYIENGKYRYVRGQDVKPFVLQDSENRFIPEDDFTRLSKYALKEKDILVSVVGTLGNACIVQNKDIPAIFSCKSSVIRSDSFNPVYILSYLNSKYGHALLTRKERGAIQKGLNLDDLKTLIIPHFSSSFQSAIENKFTAAQEMLLKSKSLYSSAEQILLQELGMEKLGSRQESDLHLNTSVKTLKESFAVSGRIDAEYYQPKYDEIERLLIQNEKHQLFKSYQIIRSKNFDYVDSGGIDVIKTKQVKKGSINFYFDDTTSEKIANDAKLPLIQDKDLVFASMGKGSMGKISLYYSHQYNRPLTIDSTLRIFRKKADSIINEESLLVLINSDFYQEYILKYEIGSTGITSLYETDINNLLVPKLSNQTQNIIKDKIHESFRLSKQSKGLLEAAKTAVEIAIERNEEEAMKYLKEFQ